MACTKVQILHTGHVRQVEAFTGRRVIVVGGSISAGDMAQAAAVVGAAKVRDILKMVSHQITSHHMTSRHRYLRAYSGKNERKVDPIIALAIIDRKRIILCSTTINSWSLDTDF